MGRLAPGAGARRSVLRRLLLLFAVMLLGPALGFCVLGWQSLDREHQVRLRDVQAEAVALLDARAQEIVEALERLRFREEARAYFEYQDAFLPLERGDAALAFQQSPLLQAPVDPLLRGWFQWELYGDGVVYGEPEVFPREALKLQQGISSTYLDALRARLEVGPLDSEVRRTPSLQHPQWNVSGNEERGKLLEELDLAQRRAAAQGDGEQGEEASEYLGQWMRRAREDPISIRQTPFRYLAAPAGSGDAPPLLAWRLVWIPGERTELREVKRDRWILQGYAVDPSVLVPGQWTRAGRVLWVGGAHVPGEPQADTRRRSLVAGLDADFAGRGVRGAIVPSDLPSVLEIVARPDREQTDRAFHDARSRFLILVGALVVVVVLGFAVLVRGLRKEMEVLRRKEDFVAAITHELKTPLAGIRMYAELLKEGWVATPEAAEGYASRILDETDRLGHLVNQVLDLAALERGVATANARRGDLGEAVRSATALMEQRAREAGVDLQVEIEPGLPELAFDPRLVRPLVLNLVDNAIKYSARAPRKEVRVSLAREGDRLALTVADRGVGIDAPTRRRLFQPFQRAGDELTRQAPGLGIGLALVKRYAEAHHARVSLDSAPGEGTRVEVRFPLV